MATNNDMPRDNDDTKTRLVQGYDRVIPGPPDFIPPDLEPVPTYSMICEDGDTREWLIKCINTAISRIIIGTAGLDRPWKHELRNEWNQVHIEPEQVQDCPIWMLRHMARCGLIDCHTVLYWEEQDALPQ